MLRFKPQQIARQLALQFLFGLPHLDDEWTEALTEFWDMFPLIEEGKEDEDVPAYLCHTLREKEKTYATGHVCTVMEHLKELDNAITSSLDNWAPERVGRIEWAVLRLAASELMYADEVPVKVVLSEAMRLANLYGDEYSARFVNGVLNRILEKKEES